MRFLMMAKVILVVMGLMLLVSTGAFANNVMWFAQDDFVLDFSNTPGNPGAPGTTFTITGRIVNWDNPGIVGWFKAAGIGAGAVSVGTQWVTDYATTLNIYAPLDNTMSGPAVWSGQGNLQTIVNQDGSEFGAGGAVRPSWETDPVKFKSVGSGQFSASYQGGEWADCGTLYIPWFGTYNWNYIPVAEPHSKMTGNLQGALTCVPEPMSVALGIMGLATVGGFRRFRGR
jgi:hypothetical protein